MLRLLSTQHISIIILDCCVIISHSQEKNGRFDVQLGRRGRDRMVAGFTTTFAISAYYH